MNGPIFPTGVLGGNATMKKNMNRYGLALPESSPNWGLSTTMVGAIYPFLLLPVSWSSAPNGSCL